MVTGWHFLTEVCFKYVGLFFGALATLAQTETATALDFLWSTSPYPLDVVNLLTGETVQLYGVLGQQNIIVTAIGFLLSPIKQLFRGLFDLCGVLYKPFWVSLIIGVPTIYLIVGLVKFIKKLWK